MDYNRNQLYFNPIPEKSFKTGVIFAIAGIIILIIGINSGVVGIVIGLVVIGLGVLLIVKTVNYNKNRTIITDAEIDTACADHLKDLKSLAMKKLGIDEEQVKEADPIQIDDYYYKDLRASTVQYKKGDDGRFRSSHYNAVMFLFSAERVFCYEYRFSLLTDEKQEETVEIHYNDIDSVLTKSDEVKYGSVPIKFENFTLNSRTASIGATVFDMGKVERSVNAMRNLVRSKQSHR